LNIVEVRISKAFVMAALTALLVLGVTACGGDDGGASQDGGTTSSSKEGGFQPAPLRVSGDDPGLREAAEAMHAFYIARASDQWDATCSLVAKPMLEKLEQLASQSERKGCAELLEAFTTPMSAAAWRDITTVDADSLRVDGAQAVLVYRGAGNEVYSMPMREEDGEWRVGALMATPLG
jgi:hypothetical protein